MYSGILELQDTNRDIHPIETNEPIEVHFVMTPELGKMFRFHVQDSLFHTSEVLLVEYEFEDDNEVRYIHTKNSTYKLSELDGEGIADDDNFIEWTTDDDNEL